MGAKINQKSIQTWSPRWNASWHRFLTHFNGFWEASWEAKWTKNRSKKALEKGFKKETIFQWFWKVLGGVSPCRGHPDGWIVRPPKRPNTTGTGQMGLGKGKGLGKDTRQVDRMTHSRRRAKRGGGYLLVLEIQRRGSRTAR